jgi:hypothetical protein
MNIGRAFVRRIGDEDFFLPGPVCIVAVFEAAFGKEFVGHCVLVS